MAEYLRLKYIEALLFLGLIIVGVVLGDSDENVSRKKRASNGFTDTKDIKDFPYLVSIAINDIYTCSGSILGPYHVLTSCNCVKFEIGLDVSPKYLKVRAGSNYWNESGSLHDVISLACDPRWKIDSENFILYDVALLVINKPFELDNVTRKAIKLWKQNGDKSLYEQAGQYASWGAVNHTIRRAQIPDTKDPKVKNTGFINEPTYPQHLQYASAKFVDPTECSINLHKLIKNPYILTHNCLKTYNDSKVCNGDTGSSLIVDNQVAGIVSSVLKPNQDCVEEFYSTDVTMSAKWIESFIKSSTKVIEQAFIKNVSVATYGINERKVQAAEGNLLGEIVDSSNHVVSILQNDWYLCSGSIVSPSHVISAAHCFQNYLPKELSIRAGSNYWYTGGSLHNVSEVISHPYAKKLKTTWIYDVAVIKISDTFNFQSKLRQPVMFYYPVEFDALFYAGIPGWQSGWEDFYVLEKESKKAIIPSLRIQNIIVKVEDAETCYGRARIPSQLLNETFQHHFLCTKADQAYDGKDSYGISGSGLIIDGKLAGVASQFAPFDNSIHQYTAISTVSNWIEWVIDPVSVPKPTSFIDELQYNKSITIDYVEDLKDMVMTIVTNKSNKTPKKSAKKPSKES